MKVALVTTPPSLRSGIGDYTRHLLPYLRRHCTVELFVDQGLGDPLWGGERVRSVHDLAPRDFDQVLYQLGNELAHAFMLRMVRALGGTVAQHDWVLFDVALQAYPGLQRGGAKGHALALREGGPAQLAVYARNWIERRRARRTPWTLPAELDLPGPLLAGWHEPEADGRWCADEAALRLPARGVREVTIELHVDPPRTVEVLEEGARLAGPASGEALVFAPRRADEPLLVLRTRGVSVTPAQRAHGDARRLGAFVRRVAWRDASGAHELDLWLPCARPPAQVHLVRDRFALPLNRSVVRHADAFVVHSRFVRERIEAERNARTPIGVVHHGAERRWDERDRAVLRRELGLPEAWARGFVVASFGGVQPHKRIDKALAALARARRTRGDIYLVLAGKISASEFDPRAMARALGIEDAVRFTGYVDEEAGWSWLRAGDVALNLRGPSSGGTSGGIFQAFSVGRPVIASDAAEQRELDERCALKVPLGEGEVERLAELLVALAERPERLRRMEADVRRFVDEECHWSRVAERYAELLARFPPARAGRRSLVRLAAERRA